MSERIRLKVVTTMRYTNRRIVYFTLLSANICLKHSRPTRWVEYGE